MKEKILFSWSGGKDCTLSLYEVLQSNSYEVVSLFTIVTEDDDRSVMHSVRSKLLDLQAAALNIPMVKIYISRDDDKAYSHKMQEFLKGFQKQGVNTVAFGDIFLEDLKQYREDNLSRIGMKGLFPIWKRESTALANQFIDLQFKAILTSVDLKALDASYAGRAYNAQLVSDLPESVDPCGENGEFHTFVYEGPLFNKKIPFQIGDGICRDEHYYYCDLKMK